MDFARKNGDFEEYRKLKALNLDETLLVKYDNQ